jgi:tetratricopeptide (TPR) repeat protein
MVGAALLQSGDSEAAALRFAEALAEDPALDAAHSGLVQIHQDADHIDEAIEALSRWADGQTDPEACCQTLLRAANLQLDRSDHDSALALLREATDICPASEKAWLALCELLTPHDGGSDEDALQVYHEALDHLTSPNARARLTFLRATALAASGDHAEAAVAFGEAIALDPRSVDAALERGRLQRDLGHWGEAANGLQEFLTALPSDGEESSPPGIALIHRELGRLMAGPLEDIEEAILCYERAVSLEPEISNVREPLATLLTHFPERWPDAVHHHRQILQDDPSRQTSLLCLTRIAKESGAEAAYETGLAVQRALGTAAPCDLEDAPASLPNGVVLQQQLEDETWELARQLLLDVADEIDPESPEYGFAMDSANLQSLLSGDDSDGPAQNDEFGRSLAAARCRLIGAPFAEMPSARIASTVCALAYVAAREVKTPMAPLLARELDRQLGRRAHKRLRRTLHGATVGSILAVDFDAWSEELRALAIAVALDETQGDLRSALISLLQAGARRSGTKLDLCATGDISARVASDADARTLLQRVLASWTTQLPGRV